ncbi:hypothetical protein VNO78_25747 [Psophocarpus tetragonolobus]|uniref:Uncharacterized protein n=1 Tax=Psophocarpus tetragonolobus TaxID=3891 RepID=A0AAN9S7P1_PSOTE
MRVLVDWVPQEKVLAHPVMGGFLTHFGWNSTLESIAEEVFVLRWPSIAHQPANSRCVNEQWKIGLNMNGTCHRFFLQKMAKEVMENQMKEFLGSTKEIAKRTHDSTKERCSSYHNLENLVKDIGVMKVN